MKNEYIQEISSWNSGGGILLDLVKLKSGKVIAISGDVAILYENTEDLVTGDGRERPSFDL